MDKVKLPTHGIIKIESAYRNFRDLMDVAIRDMTEKQKEIAIYNEAIMIGGWQEEAANNG